MLIYLLFIVLDWSLRIYSFLLPPVIEKLIGWSINHYCSEVAISDCHTKGHLELLLSWLFSSRFDGENWLKKKKKEPQKFQILSCYNSTDFSLQFDITTISLFKYTCIMSHFFFFFFFFTISWVLYGGTYMVRFVHTPLSLLSEQCIGFKKNNKWICTIA